MKRILFKLFGFREGVHSLHTEVLAGFSTFIVMSYILALAPSAFSGIGSDSDDPFPVEALFSSVVIVSALSCMVMGIYAKRPLCVAPGVGLLFYVTGTMCTTMGFSWHFALLAIFIEGLLFLILSFTGLRRLVVETMPVSLRYAIGVGVGFFLASLGLKNAGMLDSGSAILSLASIVTEPDKQLFSFCILLTSVLLLYKVKGAVFISLFVSTLVGIPMGVTHFENVIKMPESPMPLFWQMEWSGDYSLVDLIISVISILFLDVFDTVGTTIGLLGNTELVRPSGRVTGMSRILQADAFASLISGVFGTSPSTCYLESATGVVEGGRTGLTPFVTALCFIVALVFSPIFLAIPVSATSGILLVVSARMFSAVRLINFEDPVEAIPSVLTILFMTIVGSISDGIVVGVMTYAVLYFISDMVKERKRRKEGNTFNE